MQIIKPQTLSLISKTYKLQSNQLAVGAIGFFQLAGDGKLLPENGQWLKLKPLLDTGFILDMGFAKPKGEVLVVGQARTVNNKAATSLNVSLSLGEINKTLVVVGDRVLQSDNKVSEPQAFTEKPLSYHLAYGHTGFAENPLGKGYHCSAKRNTDIPLANIYYPEEWQKPLNESKRVAGFEAINIEWPQRSQYQGTYDQEWADNQHPGFPLDTELKLFNCAPEDQQFKGFITAGAPYCLTGFSASTQHIKGNLPDIRVRAFVNQQHKGIVEASSQLDTVCFFPEFALGVVIYRSVFAVADSLGLDVKTLLLAYENAADAPRPASFYQQQLQQRADPEQAKAHLLNEAPLKPLKTAQEKQRIEELYQQAKQQHETRRQLALQQAAKQAQMNADLLAKHLANEDDELPPIPEALLAELEVDLSPYLEKVEQLSKQAKAQAEQYQQQAKQECQQTQQQTQQQDQALVDLEQRVSTQVLVDIQLMAQQLKQAETLSPDQQIQLAEQAKIQSSRFGRQQAPDATTIDAPLPITQSNKLRAIVETLLRDKQPLAGRDFAGADLSALDFSGQDLRDVMFEHSDLSDCNFSHCALTGTVFTKAKLANTRFDGSVFKGANLSQVAASFCCFKECQFDKVLMLQAQCEQCDFSGANISNLTAVGANLYGSNFSQAQLKDTHFTQADCSSTHWKGANIEASDFLQTKAPGASFKHASFKRCILIDIDAESADFSGVTAELVQFSNVANLAGANLSQGKWQSCGFRDVNLSYAQAQGTVFVESDFSNSLWPYGKLHKVLFHRCIMLQCQLTEADCSQSFINESSLSKANFLGANFTDARFNATDLSESLWNSAHMQNVVSTPFPLKNSNKELAIG